MVKHWVPVVRGSTYTSVCPLGQFFNFALNFRFLAWVVKDGFYFLQPNEILMNIQGELI